MAAAHPQPDHGKPKTAEITVNGQPVTLAKERLSGLEIKEAAIRAGVPIQVDFVLSQSRSMWLKSWTVSEFWSNIWPGVPTFVFFAIVIALSIRG